MHLIIASTCARCRNFSSFRSACSRGSFAARTDESRGSWGGSSRCAASTRTSDRKFHGDNLQESAVESVDGSEMEEKHFSEIMLRRDSNFKSLFVFYMYFSASRSPPELYRVALQWRLADEPLKQH